MDFILQAMPLTFILSVFIYVLLFSKVSSKDKLEKVEKKPLEVKTIQTKESNEESKSLKPFSDRLKGGLEKTRADIWKRVVGLLQKKIDQDVIDEIEEILYSADMSPSIVAELIEQLQALNEEDNYLLQIKSFLKDKMQDAQAKLSEDLFDFNKGSDQTKVIMIVGVNGAGKTTTIGKLATKLKSSGASVVVGACDTFRAAAVEQLQVWCQRAGVEMIKAQEGANPSGVAFDTVKRAQELKANYCIIDTAGRLHTASNLMDELTKTKRVMSKVIGDAPHEVLLVIDAITGQNALRQAQEFNKSLDLTGLIFTKCDGSAKAGSAVGIVKELNVPIAYIGVGEEVEDLDRFVLDNYLDALLGT